MRCPVEAPILPSSYANEECEGKRISERRLAGELAAAVLGFGVSGRQSCKAQTHIHSRTRIDSNEEESVPDGSWKYTADASRLICAD